MFDQIEKDFARLIAESPAPHRVYECRATYREASGKTHHYTERIASHSREIALEEFLTRADNEYDGCCRIYQSSRIAPKDR